MVKGWNSVANAESNFIGRWRPVIRHPLSPFVATVVFIIALVAYYNYIGIWTHLPERPCSIHVSAQTQRASIAQNYYRIDMNFFKPRINNFTGEKGITGSEFPIIYYLAAISYKLFGFNDMYLKLINLLVFSLGVFYLFRLSQLFVRNAVVSCLLVAAVITSPVLLYYSANVSPDTAAFGLVLSAWYFFFRFIHTHQKRQLYLFLIFATLAALIKVVSAMCFGVVLVLVVLDRFGLFKEGDKRYLLPRHLALVLGIVVGSLLTVAWYYYCRVLSAFYGNPPSLMQTMMVSDIETLKDVWQYARNWVFDYYSYETYVLLLCAIVVVFLFLRRANRLLLAITVTYLLGSLCYVYLFLFQFMHHDYYIIAVLPVVVFLLLTLFDLVTRLALRYSQLIVAALVLVMFFNLKESVVKTRKIYVGRFEGKNYFAADYRPYYDLRPRLRERGILWEHKFAVAFDNTLCSSLYFMDQAGFTIGDEASPETVKKILDRPNIKYLVLSDSARFNRLYPNHFENNILMYHRGLIIYKLR